MFKDSNFTGNLSQSVQITIKMYDICSRQYNLTRRQMSDVFLHIFDGAARNFYFTNRDDAMSYEHKRDMMLMQYNSDVRQMQIKGILDILRCGTTLLKPTRAKG